MNPAIPYVVGCAMTYLTIRMARKIQEAEGDPKVTPQAIEQTVTVRDQTPAERLPVVEFILARLQESPRFGPGSVEALKRDTGIRNTLWNHEPTLVSDRLRCPTCKPSPGVYRPCFELRAAATIFLDHQDFNEEWLR